MREIVLDTETTGLHPKQGHRIIEIGCLELFDKIPTGNYLHLYFNPERNIEEESFKVHGLSEDFLRDKPLFKDVYKQILEFIANDTVVAHNASFDINFINHELTLINCQALSNKVVDTLKIARKMYPGSPVSLNALCRKFKIGIKHRELHGAIKDSDLLAKVYYFLSMQNNNMLELSSEEENANSVQPEVEFPNRQDMYALEEKYKVLHNQFLSKINAKKNW